MDIQELETELTELRTKVESYAAEMRTPLANAITREEEELVVNLGREVEKRKKDMLALNKKKNEVHLDIPFQW